MKTGVTSTAKRRDHSYLLIHVCDSSVSIVVCSADHCIRLPFVFRNKCRTRIKRRTRRIDLLLSAYHSLTSPPPPPQEKNAYPPKTSKTYRLVEEQHNGRSGEDVGYPNKAMEEK